MKYPTRLSVTIAACLMLLNMGATGVSQATDAPAQFDTGPGTLQAAVADTTDRIIVKYHEPAADGTAFTAMSRQVTQVTGYAITTIGRTSNGARVLKLGEKLPLASVRRIVGEIEAYAEVEYAEPDLRMYPLFTPDDPRYNEQWDYYEEIGGIRLPESWDITRGENSVVAVVDTGYRPHRDLLANLLPGFDMISDPEMANDGDGRDDDPLDAGDAAAECGTTQNSWHGTHVSGTVAAVGNNGIGVTGVAYRAMIQPVRALGKCGGYLSDIADAIVWASGANVTGLPLNQTPAQVINLSLGGSASSCPQTFQQAIDTARQRGSTIVVAAGNSAQDSSETSPANCNGVIVVAASTRSAELASFSNTGEGVDIAAPGVGILSTYNDGVTTPGNDSYAYQSGTSMATPHVSGVAALLYAVKPDITPNAVEHILKLTARAFPAPCSGCGAGILDAAAALEHADVPPPPDEPELVTLENGVPVSGLSGALDSKSMFAIEVPAGASELTISLSGGTGDADLYVRFGEAPTLSEFDCRPYINGNEETCRMQNLQAGRYYVMLQGYNAFSDATLVAAYRPGSSEPEPDASFENTADYPIPNYRFSGVSSPIEVSLERESGRIEMQVEIKHGYIREIRVDLLDPLGHSHTLKGFGGSDGTNISETYSLDLGTLPANGTWALRVWDFGYRGIGYIDSWRITFH